jgi:competence protein ComEA
VRTLFAAIVTLGISATLLPGAQDNLPEDKDKETFVKMCSNCHAIDRVVKVKFSKKFWAATVDDMVSRGAEGTEEEVEAVLGYLVRHFSKPINVNTATAKELQDSLSLKPADAEAFIKYRTDNGPFKTLEDLAKVPGLNQKLIDSNKKIIQF